MTFIPKPHEIYKHFKGNLYQITAVAEHTETGEMLVIYQAMYGDFKIYARPLEMFTGRVDREKYPDACQEFRFELQGPDADRQRIGSEAGGPVENLKPERTTFDVKEEFVEDSEETTDEAGPDPMLIAFLDGESYEERLNALTGMHHRITNELITTMAIACDIEVGDGDVEERYNQLRNCLLTMQKYEGSRLRS